MLRILGAAYVLELNLITRFSKLFDLYTNFSCLVDGPSYIHTAPLFVMTYILSLLTKPSRMQFIYISGAQTETS